MPLDDPDDKMSDIYLNIEFGILRVHDDKMCMERVKIIVVYIEGHPIVVANENPILNFMKYEV